MWNGFQNGIRGVIFGVGAFILLLLILQGMYIFIAAALSLSDSELDYHFDDNPLEVTVEYAII